MSVPKKYKIAELIANNPEKYSAKQIAAYYHTDTSYVYHIAREFGISDRLKSKSRIKINPRKYKPKIIAKPTPNIKYLGSSWSGNQLVLKYKCIWRDNWYVPVEDQEPVDVYLNPNTGEPVKVVVRYHWIPTTYYRNQLRFQGLRPLLTTSDPGHGLVPY
jgi:hypothetical protein